MAKNIHKEYLAMAIQLAEENTKLGGGPFGAVIVKGGEIIAKAANRVIESNDPTAHAEVEAIREASMVLGSYELSDCVLYSSCEPCPMCLGAIYWARISTVYYSSDRVDAERAGFLDKRIYEEMEGDTENRSVKMIQLKMDDASVPFRKWKDMENKTMY